MRQFLRYIGLAVLFMMLSGQNVSASAAKPTCQPTPIQFGGSFPEVEGTAANTTLWGLIFAKPPLHALDEVKIVWRMPADGDIKIIAEDELGSTVLPTWGPEEHSSSNWDRPGREWGTGFVFPYAGCWTVRVIAASTEGRVQFAVKPALILI